MLWPEWDYEYLAELGPAGVYKQRFSVFPVDLNAFVQLPGIHKHAHTPPASDAPVPVPKLDTGSECFS